jgi:hypothetical protein
MLTRGSGVDGEQSVTVSRPQETETAIPTANPQSAGQRLALAAMTECVPRALVVGIDKPESVIALRRRAREARYNGVKPEHLVIAVRAAWHAAKPEASGVAQLDMRLTRLIGLVLDAYFAPAADR